MSDGVGNTLATSGEDGDVAVSTSDLKRIVSGGTVVGDVNFNTPCHYLTIRIKQIYITSYQGSINALLSHQIAYFISPKFQFGL